MTSYQGESSNNVTSINSCVQTKRDWKRVFESQLHFFVKILIDSQVNQILTDDLKLFEKMVWESLF
jgi:hypothetical protein